MSEGSKDFALETLLDVAREVAPDLPEDLLHALFHLQKQHQFDADRDLAVQETRRLLEEFIDMQQKSGGAS